MQRLNLSFIKEKKTDSEEEFLPSWRKGRVKEGLMEGEIWDNGLTSRGDGLAHTWN